MGGAVYAKTGFGGAGVELVGDEITVHVVVDKVHCGGINLREHGLGLHSQASLSEGLLSRINISLRFLLQFRQLQ